MGAEDPLEALRARLKEWERTTLAESLKSLPERRKDFTTTSFIPISRLYTPLDIPTFARGAHPAVLDHAALIERRQIQGYDVSVLDAVYHVVEHFGMHTGQIILIAKARSGKDLALWRPTST